MDWLSEFYTTLCVWCWRKFIRIILTCRNRIRRKINNLKTEELRKNIFACLFSVLNTISSHVTSILVRYMYTYRIEKNYFLKSIWNCAVWDSRRLKDVALTSLFFTIADFKQENVYFDSFFWLWNYIHLHNFFSNNKSLLSSTRTSYINVWNNKHWNVSERSNFLLHLDEKQLGLLGGISHSPICFWYVKSLLFSFCVYILKGDDALTYQDQILSGWRDGYANAYIPV